MRTRIVVGWAALGLVATAPVSLQLGPAGAAPGQVTCQGATATIVGTPGDDILIGTRGRDVIVGLDGDDRIRGRGGNDVLCGDVGADVLQGGPGNDRLYGGTGEGEGRPVGDAGDRVWDGDLLLGGTGADLLDLGYDQLPEHHGTGEVWDSIGFLESERGVRVNLSKGTARGEGHDTVVVEAERIRMVGSRHDDTVRAGQYALAFVGGAGADKAVGSDQQDLLYPGLGVDSPYRGLRVTVGEGGKDQAYGRAGDDRIVLREGGGRDTLDGGPGADYLWYESSAAVRLDAGAGDDEVDAWLTGRDGSRISMGPAGDEGDRLHLRPPRVETIDWDMVDGSFLINGEDRHVEVTATPWVSLARDGGRTRIQWTISGTDRAEYLFNTTGSTRLYGRGGDDTLRADEYDDFFDGGDGDDTYRQDLGGTNTCVSVEHDPWGYCAS